MGRDKAVVITIFAGESLAFRRPAASICRNDWVTSQRRKREVMKVSHLSAGYMCIIGGISVRRRVVATL